MKSGILGGSYVKDDTVWQGHPDVALFKDKIYVVYRESDEHMTTGATCIKVVHGKMVTGNLVSVEQTWFGYVSDPKIIASSLRRLNCPRLSVIGDTLWMICDEVDSYGVNNYFEAENDPTRTRIFLWKTKDGENWEGPIHTNITGIVPDRIVVNNAGTTPLFCIGTHCASSVSRKSRLIQRIWHSDNLEEGNFIPYVVSDYMHLSLCEGSFFQSWNFNCCLMRENSGYGSPSYLSVSSDWKKWSNPIPTRMFGCHRPVVGVLRSNNVLVTYRENSHIHSKSCWAKNTFAYLIKPDDWGISAGAVENPDKESIRTNKGIILPLDHDSSQIRPDSGYTGWVQLPDDSIFIVNYITNDAPTPYIKWYLIRESEF